MSVEDESLLYAASNGEIKQVQKLLATEKCNVDAHDRFGSSSALIAASRNDLAMLKVLAEAGANLDLTDRVGRTPRAWAEYHQNQAMLDYIDSNITSDTPKPTT